MASRGPRRLQVSVTDGRGRPWPSNSLGRWVSSHAPAKARGHLAIALVTDTAMRRMNAQYRDADYATDVLSFPSGAPGVLGDIAIARGVAIRQARAQGHSETIELRILALHGLLHLLGYDHERDRGEMRRIEDRLRLRAGLPAGLISRQSRSLSR